MEIVSVFCGAVGHLVPATFAVVVGVLAAASAAVIGRFAGR
jgi:hypothetical protein